ncbi:MAG: hypothetical protein HGB34_03025 [Candidatus Moranbacteria bacterium]|nr:hypothetical protein [Candidatus Moranbacteria bacterium]
MLLLIAAFVFNMSALETLLGPGPINSSKAVLLFSLSVLLILSWERLRHLLKHGSVLLKMLIIVALSPGAVSFFAVSTNQVGSALFGIVALIGIVVPIFVMRMPEPV